MFFLVLLDVFLCRLRAVCLFCFVCFVCCSFAQSTTQTFSTAGHFHEASDMRLSWVVGESVVLKLDLGDRGSLYQGFVQGQVTDLPFKSSSGIDGGYEVLGDDISYYPNPVRRILTIEDPNEQIFKAVLYDASGSVLKDVPREVHRRLIEIDMHAMSEGLYIVRLFSENNRPLVTFRVVKAGK